MRYVLLILTLAGCATTSRPLPPEDVFAAARGTWANADSTFYARTDSTSEQHELYRQTVITDSTVAQTIVSRYVSPGWEPRLDASRSTYRHQPVGDRLRVTFADTTLDWRMVIHGDTLWFTDASGGDRSPPLLRQPDAGTVPAALVGRWELRDRDEVETFAIAPDGLLSPPWYGDEVDEDALVERAADAERVDEDPIEDERTDDEVAEADAPPDLANGPDSDLPAADRNRLIVLGRFLLMPEETAFRTFDILHETFSVTPYAIDGDRLLIYEREGDPPVPMRRLGDAP